MSRQKFIGTLKIPGDKSISHRALMFSLLAEGQCRIEHLSPAQDCQNTIACLRQLGVSVKKDNKATHNYTVCSPSLTQIAAPSQVLDAGNSGTTIRLLAGLLAGSGITCTLTGDASLQKRPMARVLTPLQEMGANIDYNLVDGCAPFTINGRRLVGQEFQLKVASAQVQTALLLAGLSAEGTTSVAVPSLARDHTERMFSYLGVPFSKLNQTTTSVTSLAKTISPYLIEVPGDISSAAFFMVAAACTNGSQVILTNVGINPGRALIIDVLLEMGVDLQLYNRRDICGEPTADIRIKGSEQLGGATIDGARLASGIDEIPILALLGTLSQGTFSVRDAQELQVKESDRLQSISFNLKSAGAVLTEQEDGFTIQGQGRLRGGSKWQTRGDHRLAMTGMVASLLSDEPVIVDDAACLKVSYPDFQEDLTSLCL